jgi:hypothetical protein
VLRLAKEVNDYRNAMSHPAEHDLPTRDARRLLDSAHRLLKKVDRAAAEQILVYEDQLERVDSPSHTVEGPGLIKSAGLRRRQIPRGDEVLVVPAGRHARDDYYTYSAYICQPNRAFRSAARLAFYTEGRILIHIPRIRAIIESVSLNDAGFEEIKRTELTSQQMEQARALLQALLRDPGALLGRRRQAKFVLLSGPTDDETVKLSREVVNNKRDHRGRPTAFTQSQRYVSLSRLRQATTTSELE